MVNRNIDGIILNKSVQPLDIYMANRQKFFSGESFSEEGTKEFLCTIASTYGMGSLKNGGYMLDGIVNMVTAMNKAKLPLTSLANGTGEYISYRMLNKVLKESLPTEMVICASRHKVPGKEYEFHNNITRREEILIEENPVSWRDIHKQFTKGVETLMLVISPPDEDGHHKKIIGYRKMADRKIDEFMKYRWLK